jgi:hypothetical protein
MREVMPVNGCSRYPAAACKGTKILLTPMEIISRLIRQLQTDTEHEPNLDRMIETTRQLYEELLLLRRTQVKESQGPERKVSVILPGLHSRIPHEGLPPAPSGLTETGKAPGEPASVPVQAASTAAPVQEAPEKREPAPRPKVVSNPEPEHPVAASLDKSHAARTAASLRSRQEHLAEILQQHQTAKPVQQPIREINETVTQSSPSLNERLKPSQVDLGAKLSSSGISDLRQALGLNDRFVYINELFRGDQDMFERSMITINNAGSLDEARYWIERELKIKLGWLDEHPLVQQFYDLVNKRFS